MLDDACFFAVNSLVEDVFVLTTSFTTYFMRPVSEGVLVARGRVVHAGKSVLLAEAHLEGSDGKEVGRGNGAFMKSRILLSSLAGYGDVSG
jgi:acyl-coenzyme A thioesterase PaaI-like protein